MMPANTPQKFWARFARNGECLVWTGGTFDTGYGTFQMRGHQWHTHRLAWILRHGPIPKGMFVLHRCDNPPCAEDNHLFLGTQRDNMIDRDLKGRVAYGERNGSHKLTEKDVAEILGLTELLTDSELSRRFAVSRRTIMRIRQGTNWRRVAEYLR